MSRKRYIILLGLVFTILMAGQVLAQISFSPLDQTVTITNGPVADKPVVNLTITNGKSEKVTFLNNSGVQITVNNTSTPPGQADKDGGAGNNVANNAFQDYTFSCPADAGAWVFTITQGTTPINVTVNVTCKKIPTLTQWGMIILIALIIITGVYLWMRRKPAAA